MSLHFLTIVFMLSKVIPQFFCGILYCHMIKFTNEYIVTYVCDKDTCLKIEHSCFANSLQSNRLSGY